MPHTPLAEQLRPKTLNDVVGQSHFIALSAVFAGVKDIRQAMDMAQEQRQQGLRTVLFVDEVHRFNKAVNHCINQQIINLVVQLFVLPRCSMGVKYG